MTSERSLRFLNGPQNTNTPANHKKQHSRQNSRYDPSADTKRRQQLTRILIRYIGRSNILRFTEMSPNLHHIRIRILSQVHINIAANPGHDPPLMHTTAGKPPGNLPVITPNLTLHCRHLRV